MAFAPKTFKELMDAQYPSIDPYIDGGVLNPQSRLLLFGPEKSWKSFLTYHMAFCLSEGKPWFSFNTRPHGCKVFLLQAEIPEPELQQRMRLFSSGTGLTPSKLWILTEPRMKLDTTNAFHNLKSIISTYRPNVLIIDPIYRFLAGDISSSSDITRFLDNMDNLRESLDLSIVLVGHTRKIRFDENGERIRGAPELMGSSYFPNWVDGMIDVAEVRPDLVEMVFLDMRLAKRRIDPVRFRVNRDLMRFEPVNPGMVLHW